jgi:hypothetical protein
VFVIRDRGRRKAVDVIRDRGSCPGQNVLVPQKSRDCNRKTVFVLVNRVRD